jgi:hypothetical protein
LKFLKYTYKLKNTAIGLFSAIVCEALAYSRYKMLGFPDGHLTEYERLLKSTMYPIFFTTSAFFILIFFWFLFKKKKNGSVLFLYFTFVILSIAIAYYFSLNLENGQGG